MSTLHPKPQPQPTLAQLAEQQQQRHVCTICGNSFKKVSHYNRHINQRHNDSRDYMCTVEGCNKTFKRGSHLKRHMISHTNEKKYQCDQCIMSFGYKHHLDRHIRLIHLSERLECVSCNLKFIKKKAYNKHISKFHNENSTQDQVSKKKNKQTSFQQKMADHCTNTKIGIEESIRHEDLLDSHSSELTPRQQQINEKQMYRCHYENCLSAFFGLYEFKRHLSKIHAQE